MEIVIRIISTILAFQVALSYGRDAAITNVTCNTKWNALFETSKSVPLAELRRALDRINSTIRQSGVSLKSAPKYANGSPVSVFTDIKMIKAIYIDTVDNVYQLDTQLTEVWFDERFKDPSNTSAVFTLHNGDVNEIWTPKTILDNVHKLSMVTVDSRIQSFVLISSNGFVAKRSRDKITIKCHMDLTLFPFDNHRCSLRLKSIQLIASLEHNYETCPNRSSIDITDDYISTDWQIEIDDITRNCSQITRLEEQELTNGSNSKAQCLEFEINFYRKHMWYSFSRVLPSVCLVSFSFTSFLVPITEHTSRLTIILVPLSWFLYSNRNFVIKEYVTAINVWYTGNIFYVLCVLVEYFIAFYSVQVIRANVEEQRKKFKQFVQDDHDDEDHDKDGRGSPSPSETSTANASPPRLVSQAPMAPSSVSAVSAVNGSHGELNHNVSNHLPTISAAVKPSPATSDATVTPTSLKSTPPPGVSALTPGIEPASGASAYDSRFKSPSIRSMSIARRMRRREKNKENIVTSRLKLIWNFSFLPADVTARVAFPLSYALFVYFYVLIYIIQ
ncbi:Glutamate-gated chloride channel alpha [Halotydeus destructor]|nr:Glutamate-gated chloride channel alpha [Halotydeus destructor]